MTDHNAKYNQADALKDEGKLDEAIELLNEIVTEDPNHSISHFALQSYMAKWVNTTKQLNMVKKPWSSLTIHLVTPRLV